MKKILSIALISAITLILSTSCSSTPNHVDAKVSKEALYVNTHDNKKILHAIEKAGKRTGWEIIEFKSNEIVAEKTNNGHTVSSSIKFADGHIEFGDNDSTSDLRGAIEDELSKDSSSH